MSKSDPEPKPEKPGSFYGEVSPQKQWFWNGTGRPDDAWQSQVAPEVEAPEVQPLALPVAKGTNHYIMGAIAAKVYQDHSSKPGPGGIQMTIGHCQTMNPADLIKAFGLTG